MTKKYEFTGETKEAYGVTLRRIRRLKDGLLGGWIEHERNLSHEGECFVYDDACVIGHAYVSGDASVSGNARVFGNSRVSGDAWVRGNANVSGNARVFGDAWVSGNARVSGVCSRMPVVLSGLAYTVTITDEHVRAGCECHTPEAWKAFTSEQIEEMDGDDALEFYPRLLRIIEEFC